MTEENPEPGGRPQDEGAEGPEMQGMSGPGEGGAAVSDEGTPLGFGAAVGGAEPGMTSDPQEAAELNNAREAPDTGAADR